jgi:hypothetical protein
MPRIIGIISLAGSALSAAPHNFPIALSYGADDTLIANVTITTAEGAPTIPMKLTEDELYVVSTPSFEEGPAAMIFDHAEHAALVLPFRSEEALYVSPPSSAYFGIGAGSRFVQENGAVAIIKSRIARRARMIVGFTLDNFVSTCAPGSLMTLDFSNVESPIQVNTTLTNGTVVLEQFGFHRLVIDSPGSYRTTVPPAMYTRIEELLIAQGAARMPEDSRRRFSPRRFSSCSETIIDSLPSIEFATPVGSIIYFPEDYLEFSAEDNTCRLHVWRGTPGGAIKFSPLMLVGSNVRITRDNILQICETAASF